MLEFNKQVVTDLIEEAKTLLAKMEAMRSFTS